MSRQALKAYAAFLFTALAIYFGTYSFLKLGWIEQMPSFTFPILFFFVILTAVIYKYIIRFSTYGAATEMQFYMGSIVLKLLVGCGLLWVLAIADRPNVTSNAVLFLVSYLLFTGVEVQQLMAAKKG